MSKLGNFDGIDSFEIQPKSKVETVHSATENDRRKLEHIAKVPESNSKDGLDSDKGKVSIEKGRLNKRDEDKISEKSGDIVQSGTALENLKYGEGDGKQYFIPDASRKPIRESNKIPLKNGSLENVGETNLHYDNSESKTYSPNNKRPHSESEREQAELKQLDENTPANSIDYYKQEPSAPKVDSSPLSKSEQAEWKQLDDNTLDEIGLPKAMPKGEQKDENWKHAHSNQENRGPDTNPDSWTNPRQLKDGEKFYQLRPSNENAASDYFTDAETVNKCKKENGDVDVGKLLNALQVDRGDNKDWALREYVYRKK